ncbi:MAG: ankyrin repeat domain-containing protein [Candidatus Eisenbacteria bacterium]|nr:ankyrin repeat domain-containing protein [Candidatus Eisenbacteria bacterium]
MVLKRFLDAIRSGDAAAVSALLAANPQLATTRDGSGISAILLALYHGHAEIATALLATGVALDLPEACAAGRVDRVRALLEEDRTLADATAPDGFTPLGLAAFFGRREVVDALLAHGTDVNAVSTNATGYTALTGAVARGDRDIVAALLAHGARPDHRYAQGHTALHEAAAGGKLEIARLLLDHGADPNARTDSGVTPLALSREKQQAAVAALLQERGAAG